MKRKLGAFLWLSRKPTVICMKWCSREAATIQNNILEEMLVTTSPWWRLWQMFEQASLPICGGRFDVFRYRWTVLQVLSHLRKLMVFLRIFSYIFTGRWRHYRKRNLLSYSTLSWTATNKILFDQTRSFVLTTYGIGRIRRFSKN